MSKPQTMQSIGRRGFMRLLASAGGAALLPQFSLSAHAASAYAGKYVIALQLDGGVDVTSWCDPKMNVPGEPEINRWARTAETQQIGNISYAPYADNAQFFEKYYKDILVINGVDAQTNAHTVGVTNNWSGRNSEGFPTITSLFASASAPDLPLAYLNFGGFGNTQGIIRSTQIQDVSVLNNIIFPNEESNPDLTFRLPAEWQAIQELQIKNLERINQSINVPEGNKKTRRHYLEAFTRAGSIQDFGRSIPSAEQIEPSRQIGRGRSTLHQQIQVTLLAFKSGVSVAADLFEGGFDTHTKHEEMHIPLLTNLADALDYLWTSAEELGLADNLILMIGSDFGRTPFFNSSDGKDHWPIGSYMMMEKNVDFTNNVIGETDGGHNAFKIGTTSLQRDDQQGIIIRPVHVHKAFRRHLGIQNHVNSLRFPFGNVEDFGFFG